MTGLLFPLNATEILACLSQAVDEQVPLTLYWRQETAMLRGRSRFLATHAEEGSLWIAPPQMEPAAADRLPQPGQMIGISFNDETRKYISDVEAIRQQDILLADGRMHPALGLRWPESMHQFQRRLHFRTKVPRRLSVAVDVSRLGEDSVPERGLMQDISPGGLGLTLPNWRTGMRWAPGDAVQCSFSLGKDMPLESVPSEVRYCDQSPRGETHLGIRFKELHSFPGGEALLERIRQTAEAYRYADTRRRTRRGSNKRST